MRACRSPHFKIAKTRRVTQPQMIVLSAAICYLLVWRLGHVRALCSVDAHMLHLRGARCGRSAAASAGASAACARDSPSAPDRTPPLAIYVRGCALFLFWRWFSIRSFLFSLVSSTVLNIAISHPLTSWLRAYSVGLSRLCVRYLR